MAVKTVKAVINGQTYDLSYNSMSQNWEATISAPNQTSYNQSGHYYSVQIKAEDDAGNITTKDASDEVLGESLQLRVLEKNPPEITITYPTSDAHLGNSSPKIEWNVVDGELESGVNETTISIKIDDDPEITGEAVSKEGISNGFKCSYTPSEPLSDGIHVITFKANDNDGNSAETKTVSFSIDTVPPTLNITSPTDNLVTNQSSLTVSGTTNDTTSSPVTVTIQVNSGLAESVEVQENGAFSKEVTLAEGANVITVVATDSAGKQTTVIRNVTLSTSAPVIVSVSIVPNPVDAGKTFIISATVTDE